MDTVVFAADLIACLFVGISFSAWRRVFKWITQRDVPWFAAVDFLLIALLFNIINIIK